MTMGEVIQVDFRPPARSPNVGTLEQEQALADRLAAILARLKAREAEQRAGRA